MTHNLKAHDQETITLELPHDETTQESLDRLGREIAELRRSRERLVLGADADRRTIERDLHEGLQQHLVSLAVKLQLASPLVDSDPVAARELLEEMGRDVQEALNETARLALRIYPQLLEAGGLAAALRAAVANGVLSASVGVAASGSCPSEIARTVYLCCLEALELTNPETRATIEVREEESALAFEVVAENARLAPANSGAQFERLRDRVEALGGRLTIQSKAGRGVTVSGTLPFAR
jgi:signal transduction histidine kinase